MVNFGDRAIREALALLREAGVTPDEYRHVHISEVWKLDDVHYPTMRAAFEAGKAKAVESGEWVEVWHYFTWDDGRSKGGFDSWVIKPNTEFGPSGYPRSEL